MQEPTAPPAIIPTGTISEINISRRVFRVEGQLWTLGYIKLHWSSCCLNTNPRHRYVFFIPVSSKVIIMVPGPKEFQAVQLYGEWKSDSITLLMVRVEMTAPPSDGGLLCSTV